MKSMSDIDTDRQVGMYHKETGNVGTATLAAFNVVWSKNGWSLVTEEVDSEKLFEAAARLGIPVSPDADAKELSQLLTPTQASEPEVADPEVAVTPEVETPADRRKREKAEAEAAAAKTREEGAS